VVSGLGMFGLARWGPVGLGQTMFVMVRWDGHSIL